MRYLGMIMLLVAIAQQGYSRGYGMAGCGGGSIIMGPNGGQISAASSNATSYQSFAITTGTSNCVPDSKVEMAERSFINHNLAVFEKEVAQGEGQTLTAFSDILGCDSGVRNLVNIELKKSYSKIFAEPGAIAVLLKAKSLLKKSQDIANSCSNLS